VFAFGVRRVVAVALASAIGYVVLDAKLSAWHHPEAYSDARRQRRHAR
jgi:hypothetical protein